jgi:hypothetical protein
MPGGTAPVVIVSAGGVVGDIDSVNCPEAVWPLLSVTVIVTGELPLDAGVPVISPVLRLVLRGIGKPAADHT